MGAGALGHLRLPHDVTPPAARGARRRPQPIAHREADSGATESGETGGDTAVTDETVPSHGCWDPKCVARCEQLRAVAGGLSRGSTPSFSHPNLIAAAVAAPRSLESALPSDLHMASVAAVPSSRPVASAGAFGHLIAASASAAKVDRHPPDVSDCFPPRIRRIHLRNGRWWAWAPVSYTHLPLPTSDLV